MIQIVEQTDKEKMAMYMKCSKKELAEMLIQCNKHLDTQCDQCFAPLDEDNIYGTCSTCYFES